ncbi:MAG TPA: glycosyltransferase family 4 protein [Cyclobacteriaceae bacterium]|nr:glycosyltransferase family 4 protein [Cyclobacteriaceae bacterium]
MRIVSVQYVQSNFGDPQAWLNRIDFYTGIFDELAKQFDVHVFYHTRYGGHSESNHVKYHFTGIDGWSLKFPFGFHRQIAKLNPDIILAQGFHHPFQLWLLKKQLRKGVQFFIHHHADRPLRFPRNFFQRRIDHFVAGYFFVSRQQAEEWIHTKQIGDERKVHEVMECSSIYRPIDRGGAREKTKVNGKIYLWVGRLESNKDPLTLIKAFVKFLMSENEASLYLIYQQDDLLEESKALAQGHDRIIFVGRQDKEQLRYWYNSADFIVSTSHYEGSGIAVCEAMSCGCIPVLSSIASFRWMTNEKVGLHFNAGDVDQLCQALEKSLQLDMSMERKAVIENFQRRLSFLAIASAMANAFSK